MYRLFVFLCLLAWPLASQAQSTFCYLVADKSNSSSNESSPDRLTLFNRNGPFESNLGVITGNSARSIEAIAYHPGEQKLYGVDAGRLGTIDVNTRVFTPIGTGIGSSSNGTVGSVSFNDVDGLMFNPVDGFLYGVQRRAGSTENDVLLKINTTTGQFIANAFDTDGNGTGDRSYVVISNVSSDARVSPADPAVQLRDIDDIAFSGGTLYGIANDGSGLPRRNVLVTINKNTGAAVRVNPVGSSLLTIGDVEGLSADSQGMLYATTGNDSKNDDGSANTNARNAFYRIASNGTPTKLASLGQFGGSTISADYEAVACLLDVVGVLPVELTSFDARLDGDAVQLRWTTASETNNAGFSVMRRSAFGVRSEKQWEEVAFIDGHGTTTESQTYGFRIGDLFPGRHMFRLKQIDYDGAFDYSPEVEVVVDLQAAFQWGAAYPNPFNPSTHFTLQVRRTQPVRLVVYDVLGRPVRVLHDALMEAGRVNPFTFEAGALASGWYMIRLDGERASATQRVLLVK